MTEPLDLRTNAFRPDLAAMSLKGVVEAERFVEPVLRQAIKGVTAMHAVPMAQSPRVSEIKYGEILDVFEVRDDGFAWVQNRGDHYVGYVDASCLSERIGDYNNRVDVLLSHVYPAPDIKTVPVDCLTLGSHVHLGAQENGFFKLGDQAYIYRGHVTSVSHPKDRDVVATAGRLLGVPYLWGGKTPLGIDCSGLVQLALGMADIECPRDSDQQYAVFGEPLSCDWRDFKWQRGDLVFFKGHVGFMVDVNHILHATADGMCVRVESLTDVVKRGGAVLGFGRLVI